MTISPTEFEYYREFLLNESGLALNAERTYLLESRLSPIIKRMGLDDVSELTRKLKARDAEAQKNVIEAMTVNETFFFRDTHVFKRFCDVIMPEIMKSKPAGATIRIWCAACSSGQEAYSLAIMIKENAAKIGDYNFEIIATDLSESILDVARSAKYSQFEVQRGVPTKLLLKYFTQKNDDWFLNDEIKQMVQFDTFNLMGPMEKFGIVDFILCRNVLSYFDGETQRQVLEGLYNRCDEEGFLAVGTDETIETVTDKFKPCDSEQGIYKPVKRR